MIALGNRLFKRLLGLNKTVTCTIQSSAGAGVVNGPARRACPAHIHMQVLLLTTHTYWATTFHNFFFIRAPNLAFMLPFLVWGSMSLRGRVTMVSVKEQAQRWGERPGVPGQEVPVWSDGSTPTTEGGEEVRGTSGELCGP